MAIANDEIVLGLSGIFFITQGYGELTPDPPVIPPSDVLFNVALGDSGTCIFAGNLGSNFGDILI